MSEFFDYKLMVLHPDLQGDLNWIQNAYYWVQARPWAFPWSGGQQSLKDYLIDATRPIQRNLGVFVGGQMVSMVTVIKEGDEYRLHITSPRRTGLDLIADAARSIIHYLFKAFDAQAVYTSSPIYKGRHPHYGSMKLCEACGASPTGEIETDELGHQWKRYQITRERWQQIYGGTDGREN